MSKHSAPIARVRYLCDAGLRSEVVVPLLMDELRHIVRFGTWAFAWANAAGDIVNSAYPPLRPATLRYFAEHFDNFSRDCGYSVRDVMASFPAVSNPRLDGRLNPRMETTESWEKVWEPEGCWYSLIAVVRTAEGAPLGFVQIFRPRDDVEFEPSDNDELARVLPYLRRLLRREVARAGPVPMVQDGLSGVAVFVDDDRPGFVSDRAFALATLAFNDRLGLRLEGLELIDPLQGLRDMYREVAAAPPSPGVVRKVSNTRGDFSFEWESSVRRGARVGSVVIRHRIPARLRLVTLPEGAALSERQLEVCLGLLEGEPLAAIAARIGVKAATLKDHAREVYRKLGVGDRDGLLRKLIGLQAA